MKSARQESHQVQEIGGAGYTGKAYKDDEAEQGDCDEGQLDDIKSRKISDLQILRYLTREAQGRAIAMTAEKSSQT